MPPVKRRPNHLGPDAGAPDPPSQRFAPLERVRLWFARDAWDDARVRAAGIRGLLWRVARVAYLALRGFREDQCLFRATALTYITVLSLVPLLAFTFSVAKGFGYHRTLIDDTVNPALDRAFGKLGPEGPVVVPEGAHEMRVALGQVLDLVEKAIAETRVDWLAAIGLLVLAWTVIRLLATVERSFNDIWGVQRSRPLLRKASDYLAMVVVAPFLLFVATGITTAAQNSAAVEYLRRALHLGPLVDLLVALAPLITLWLCFTLVYLTLPNARTRLSSALVGAVVGGTLWEIALVLHIKFQVGLAHTSAIYAGFAAIPIFLVWMNLAWVSVLLGAEVCSAHQSEPARRRSGRTGSADHAAREVLALRAMARIGARFLSGGPPWTVAALAEELGASDPILEEVLGSLVRRGLLLGTRAGREEALVPARELDAITVKSVLDALKGAVGPTGVAPQSEVDLDIERIRSDLDRELEGSRHNRTIRSLAEAALQGSAADPGGASARARGPRSA